MIECEVPFEVFDGNEYNLTAFDYIESDGNEEQQIEVACRFTLDDITYKCYVDNEDGYRSTFSHINLSVDTPINKFPAVKVVAKVVENDTHDLLLFIDVKTLEKVITVGTVGTVGTDYGNDYYPYYIAVFNPKNVWYNKE